MKVQLIVVQGKPEGKAIPIQLSKFKIGRGEGCQLRPNSEQVSREHAEFEIRENVLYVRDLKSRNGTLVNNVKITDAMVLKNQDLVTVGPLVFAVSIEGVPAAATAANAPGSAKSKSVPGKASEIDAIRDDDIDSWLVADNAHNTPETKSGVYKGDTMTFEAFKANEAKSQPPTTPKAAPKAAVAPVPAAAANSDDDDDDDNEDEDANDKAAAEAAAEGVVEGEGDDEGEGESENAAPPMEWVDESNPFFKKKEDPAAAADPKAAKSSKYSDTSDAAGDILRKIMDRRRTNK